MEDWSNRIMEAAKKDPDIAKKLFEIIQLDQTPEFDFSDDIAFKFDALCLEVAKAIFKKDQTRIAEWLSYKCSRFRDQIEDLLKKQIKIRCPSCCKTLSCIRCGNIGIEILSRGSSHNQLCNIACYCNSCNNYSFNHIICSDGRCYDEPYGI